MRTALRVAGLVFACVALVHLLRWYLWMPVVFGTMLVGRWVSLLVAGIAAALAFWMIRASFKK